MRKPYQSPGRITLWGRFFSLVLMVILTTLREPYNSFNGYFENVTGTLIYSFVCNGWIDDVTETLKFG